MVHLPVVRPSRVQLLELPPIIDKCGDSSPASKEGSYTLSPECLQSFLSSHGIADARLLSSHEVCVILRSLIWYILPRDNM